MERLTGPFGLWPFPVINFLLRLVNSFTTGFAGSRGFRQSRFRPNETLQLSAENVERWELERDKGGRLSAVIVHRELKEG